MVIPIVALGVSFVLCLWSFRWLIRAAFREARADRIERLDTLTRGILERGVAAGRVKP